MTKYKCPNCDNEEDSETPLTYCGKCGDNTTEIGESSKKEISLDLNNDGKFDKEDKKIAGRVLASGKRKRK